MPWKKRDVMLLKLVWASCESRVYVVCHHWARKCENKKKSRWVLKFHMTRNERKEKKFISKVFRFIRQWRYVENLQKYRVEFERNLGKLYRSEILLPSILASHAWRTPKMEYWQLCNKLIIAWHIHWEFETVEYKCNPLKNREAAALIFLCFPLRPVLRAHEKY